MKDVEWFSLSELLLLRNWLDMKRNSVAPCIKSQEKDKKYSYLDKNKIDEYLSMVDTEIWHRLTEQDNFNFKGENFEETLDNLIRSRHNVDE